TPGGTWSPWTNVSEGVAGPRRPVTAVPAGDGRFALFLADPHGGVYSTLGDAARGWAPWVSVSEGNAGPGTYVAAVPIGGGRFAAFVADAKGGIFATSGDPISGDPISGVAMTYTVVHEYVGQALDVQIARNKGFATVRCSASGSFNVKYPGQWRKFVRARFTVSTFFEPLPIGGAPAPPKGLPPKGQGHWETVERTLA